MQKWIGEPYFIADLHLVVYPQNTYSVLSSYSVENLVETTIYDRYSVPCSVTLVNGNALVVLH